MGNLLNMYISIILPLTTSGYNYTCLLAAFVHILLTGTGHVWVDGFRFEEVDHSIPVTNLEPERELPNEPLNLAFEEL
ncbi:hypothetical protein AR543_19015 [Paenibacillus bovis]|uniref:Uncharacterized protein n=1 Tax=Paenibacillus bovis TaxID=1616788 RepID=A0A172ZKG3_9BACL|nr:hypothetical protein AR543_19015 [Paenibacillus bovis]